MTEKTEEQLTRDIFTHIRQILERDGDKAEILFNAIQLRKLLACEPPKPSKFASGSGLGGVVGERGGLGGADLSMPLKRDQR